MALEYPAMLYKAGSMLEWDGQMFDCLIVEDDDELKAAEKDGWSVKQPKGNAKAVEKVSEPTDEADDIKALRAEYKKKFGKAAFNGWDAEKLKAKLA